MRVKKVKIQKHPLNDRSKLVIFAILFGGLGTVFLLQGLAATPYASIEPENGQKVGNITATTSDSTASAGGYIQFGNVASTGVGGSGANMTPGRKCAAGNLPNTTTISSGGNLQNAVNNASAGSTVIVNAGSYAPVSINGKNNLTICGAIGSRPVINVNGGTGFDVYNSSNIHIEGFELYGSQNGNEHGIRITTNSHHVHIWDNWVHDVGGVGIGASNGYCGHIDFRYNTFWNNAYYNSYHTSGISVYEPRNCGGGADVGIYSDFIIGNTGYNNGEKIAGATDGNCIIWDDTLDQQGLNHTEGPYTGRVLIANNLCVANGGRGIHIGPTSARADVVNNTEYHNFAPGFLINADAYSGQMNVGYQSNDVRFMNNVSIARAGFNGFDNGGSTNVVTSNNIFYPVARDGGVGGYQLIADPGFTTAATTPSSWNFRPRPGSPMINAGISSYSSIIFPNVDITGKPRNTASPSIGAYEP